MPIINRAIRIFVLLPAATLGIAGCSPSASPPPGQITQQTQPSPEYRLTASIQELMDGIIDPSADVLWDSVAYIATTKGVEDRQPRTDEEWKAVRNSAITLIEAANLLSMPGRQVATPAGATAPSAASAHGPNEAGGGVQATERIAGHQPAEATAGREPAEATARGQPAKAAAGDQTTVAAVTPTGELTHAEIQQRINSTHDAFVQFARNLQDTGIKALAAIDRKDAQGLMDAGGEIDEACEACHVTYWYPNQNRPSN